MIAALIALAPWLLFAAAICAVLLWVERPHEVPAPDEPADDWHAANVAFYDKQGVTR